MHGSRSITGDLDGLQLVWCVGSQCGPKCKQDEFDLLRPGAVRLYVVVGDEKLGEGGRGC